MMYHKSKKNSIHFASWENKNIKTINKKTQEPPDIIDIFNKIVKKIFNTSSANKIKKNQKNSYRGIIFLLIFLITLLSVWIVAGFYTVKEAERGVITRFGKFNHLVTPGLNWKPTFIDQVKAVNVETVRELAASGVMLTSDENVVSVEMNVQYRVTNPERYLFSVTSADDSLRQATDSALRGVIGRSTMDRILTEGRTIIRSDTQRELEETIKPYNMGLTLLDVNFQAARPPEEVKASFDDAIAARENREQYVREAEAYANEVQPKANGQAQRILEEARAYKAKIVLEAQGEVDRFIKLLPEYKAAPDLTKKRLYIETMENVLSNTNKILIENDNNKLIFLPLNNFIYKKIDSFSKQNNKQNFSKKIEDQEIKNYDNRFIKNNLNKDISSNTFSYKKSNLRNNINKIN